MNEIQTILNLISNLKPDAVFGEYGFIVLMTYIICKYSFYFTSVYLLFNYLSNKDK